MVFSSLYFLIFFLPLTLILYFVLPKCCRNTVLLLASLVFYAWGEPIYILLMVISILLSYLLGLQMESARHKTVYLVLSVVLHVAILGFFKYYGFAVESINRWFSLSLPVRKLPLPIGISFYTFQALSYLIDVYRDRVKAQHNILHFSLYITMFPQLIAGPIVQYKDIELQLKDRVITTEKFCGGVERFVLGLGKKVLLANTLGQLAGDMQAASTPSALGAWLGLFAYTLQIYFDFSGYSDMAIGMGKMFGFSFPENFNYPYIADSIKDFWKRWHISLSSWFKEYVYIPLGGNRVGVLRHMFNIMVVWALTGLWHGASWNFVLWGMYYGVLLILEKYVFDLSLENTPIWIRRIVTLFLVMIGWVWFAFPDLSDAVRYLGALVGRYRLVDANALYALKGYAAQLILGIAAAEPFLYKGYRKLTEKCAFISVLTGGVIYILSIAFLVSGTYNPFLYFRF